MKGASAQAQTKPARLEPGLKISNVSSRRLAIHAGTRLCQIVLQHTEGHASYAGCFADQDRL